MRSPLRFARLREVWGEGVVAVRIGTGVETFAGCQDDVRKETDLLQSVQSAQGDRPLAESSRVRKETDLLQRVRDGVFE